MAKGGILVDVTMRPPVLNVILKYLERSNKILIDGDGSLIWIYASPKAKSVWEKAARLRASPDN